jgi:hypothetical protein
MKHIILFLLLGILTLGLAQAQTKDANKIPLSIAGPSAATVVAVYTTYKGQTQVKLASEALKKSIWKNLNFDSYPEPRSKSMVGYLNKNGELKEEFIEKILKQAKTSELIGDPLREGSPVTKYITNGKNSSFNIARQDLRKAKVVRGVAGVFVVVSSALVIYFVNEESPKGNVKKMKNVFDGDRSVVEKPTSGSSRFMDLVTYKALQQ